MQPLNHTRPTELTEVGGRAFTPEFAAPEQLAGGDVTVATDVYALGVLTYVLLTGRHPTAQATTTPVERLQARLKEDGFYEGKVDGDFGPRTIRAVIAFQKSRFGFNSEDGVVGPQTAEALGIDLGRA